MCPTGLFAALACEIRGPGNPQNGGYQWRPLHILPAVATSTEAVLKPAGMENARGIIFTGYLKDPADPASKDDPAGKEWSAFMDKYYPAVDRAAGYTHFGYKFAQAIVHVLQKCGDDLTRENVMRQAPNIKGFELGLLFPGIKVETSPTDYYLIEQMQMIRFNGTYWERFGPLLSGADSAS